MNTNVTALSVLFLLIDVALHVFIQFATITLTYTFARDVFSTLTVSTIVPIILTLPWNPAVWKLKGVLSRKSRTCGEELRRERNFSWTLDAGECFVVVITASETSSHC